MFIEKVSLYDNEALGDIVIPFSKGVNIDPLGNEDVTVCNKVDDGSNHYTFIIGDNGVGKTNLLNSIANIYHSGKRMSYMGTDSAKTKPFIKYVGTGLSSFDNELSSVDIKVINPNKMSIQRQILGMFCHYQDKIHLLEEHLGKSFIAQVGISINYRNETFDRKKYCRIGSYSIQASKPLLSYLTLSKDYGSPEDYSLLKEKLYGLDCWGHLLQKYRSLEEILEKLYLSEIGHLVRGRLTNIYNPMDNAIRPNNQTSRQTLQNNEYISLNNLSEDEMLMIMLLEELGIIRLSIMCTNGHQEFNVNWLSTGEKIMIKLFSIFADIPEKKKKNIIFMYDEPENSLHPQWQKEFPELVRSIIEDIYHISSSHFIFATHSPLIIMRSDNLPNNYVLRIERDEVGQLVVDEIDDIPTYNYERALLDVFDCSYYTRKEQTECEDSIKSDIERIQSIEGCVNLSKNKLKEVTSSFDLFKEIEDLYNSLTDTNPE